MAKYFRATRVPYYELTERLGSEDERGLTDLCPETNKQHEWLLLPHRAGEKHYLMCLECFERSHL